MNQKIRNDISNFVDNNKEFKYLKSISLLSGMEYEKLINYSLDIYSYYKRNDVDNREAKIQSLYRGTVYAKNYMCELEKLIGDDEQ